jgi:propanol-preferring alcohol dehydrogenase
VLGHEIVGRVETLGDNVRVGVPWLGFTDGTCFYCRSGRQNLCDNPRFTGYQIDGGYAQYTVADARYVFPIPEGYSDAEAAPLLCAGLIGYRSLKMTGEPVPEQPSRLGSAAAHIVTQVARHQGREIYVFTRPGDEKAQDFAPKSRRSVGRRVRRKATRAARLGHHLRERRRACASGAQGSSQRRRGGLRRHPHERHPELPLRESMGAAYAAFGRKPHARRCARIPRARAESAVKTTILPMPLSQANEALTRLREGELTGATVLIPGR